MAGVFGVLHLVSECIVLAADGSVWTVVWPEGYEAEVTESGSPVLTDPEGEIVAIGGDFIGVNGREAGMHPVCMIGTQIEATEIVFIEPAASP